MKPGTTHKESIFSIYWKEVRVYPLLFIGLLAGVLLAQAADLTYPLYLREFFNTLSNNSPSATIANALFSTLAIIAVTRFVNWAGLRLMGLNIVKLELNVMARLYDRAFNYLINHSYHFFTSQFAGTLTRRVSKFSDAFETLFDCIIMEFLPTALFAIGAVVVLFLRNHTLGIILGCWVVLFIGVQLWLAKIRQPARQARSEQSSAMIGTLADAISNQNTISLFAGHTYEADRFGGAVKKWWSASIVSWNTDEFIWATLGFLILAINIGLLYGAVYFWEHGQLTIGDFVLIQAYLITTIQQLLGINRSIRRFYDAAAEAKEMLDIINTPHEVQDKHNATALQVEDGTVHFKNVSFQFHPDRPILTDFNFSIAGGERIALVGPSGAGKSTITRLLLRFYDVQKGSVEIDGQNIRDVTQDSLHESVAFVPQEPILFHRTLMENIRYGRREATDEEVIEAAKKAHCHEFISLLPDQYETYVGERGVKLSGGERQRVAIARAILKNAPILVLDEATSSLDSESEALIQDALEILMKEKTVIVVAHRLSTIMKMDRIVVIEHGKIAIEGTHNELINHGSNLYHKLWSIQAGGFLADSEEE